MLVTESPISWNPFIRESTVRGMLIVLIIVFDNRSGTSSHTSAIARYVRYYMDI